jgi:hypothetical protein
LRANIFRLLKQKAEILVRDGIFANTSSDAWAADGQSTVELAIN